MQKTMRGLLKEAPRPGRFVYRTDLPVPQIDDDEVLIKVRCTALCGTDLHIMNWDDWSQIHVKTPLIPGHETAGDIVAVGKHVQNRKVGDRVSCETHIPCGSCWFCRNGMPHICENVRLFGASENGAFAEYTKIRADSTFLLDGGISYEAACLFEPMGAGVHGVERAEVSGKTVLVSGCGPIGLTAVSACKTFGAKLVIACDLVDQRLETAREMGADIALNSGTCDLAAEVRARTGGAGVDAAIDVTGAAAALRTGLKCVRAAGRMVCVGLPTKPVELDLTNDLIYREVTLTGVSGRSIWETWKDFAAVLQGPYFKIDRVMGQRFPLEDFAKAVEAAEGGVPGKMILYP
ncbi:MAG: alcohol dehydrogenase catalytic domain-containing protein [Oscillibacter sp.]|nr:alcohol dehydrogenase catalytic domain-containing protein [Oscillibacter sp.]